MFTIVDLLYWLFLCLFLTCITILYRCFLHQLCYFVYVYYRVKARRLYFKWKNKITPFQVKNNTLLYRLGGDVYTYHFKEEALLPKRLFDLLVISDGLDRDLTSQVLDLAGPYGNYYGLVVTPRDLNVERVCINDEVYNRCDTLPNLSRYVL